MMTSNALETQSQNEVEKHNKHHSYQDNDKRGKTKLDRSKTSTKEH